MENFDLDLRSVQEARNLARQGAEAAKKMACMTAEQIDKILRSMIEAAEEHASCLAKMAVEETGFGKVLDKTYKNHAASTLLYEDIRDMKTVGILSEDKARGILEVAAPAGLIMGIVPSTNPTSTVIYKSMIAIKAGNAIVFPDDGSNERADALQGSGSDHRNRWSGYGKGSLLRRKAGNRCWSRKLSGIHRENG